MKLLLIVVLPLLFVGVVRAAVHTEVVEYKDGDKVLEGYLGTWVRIRFRGRDSKCTEGTSGAWQNYESKKHAFCSEVEGSKEHITWLDTRWSAP